MADLELVVPHRLESGSYGYELTWNPPARRDDPGSGPGRARRAGTFLAGLHRALRPRPAGPSQITYDPQPVGAEAAVVGPWSGGGRGLVGPRSARRLKPDAPQRRRPDEGVTCCDTRPGVGADGQARASTSHNASRATRKTLMGSRRWWRSSCTDLGARGYSPGDDPGPPACLATLSAWLADRGVTQPVEVTRPMLVRYQRHLFHYRKPNGEPLSFRSQNAQLLPVRAFFKWAVRNDHSPRTPRRSWSCPRSSNACPSPR